MNFKELYIEEYERIVDGLETRGLSREQAERLAGDMAYDSAREVYLDKADALRQQRKDQC